MNNKIISRTSKSKITISPIPLYSSPNCIVYHMSYFEICSV